MKNKTCKNKHLYSRELKQCPVCRAEYRASAEFKRRNKDYNKKFQATEKYKKQNSEYHRRLRSDSEWKRAAARYKKKYDQEHKIKRAEYELRRRGGEPLYRLACSLRSLLSKSIAKRGYTKRSKTFQLLGGTLDQVRNHLISTAIQNYGIYDSNQKYHIDHIIPCAYAKTEEELIGLQHYTNLQYLKPEHNRAKGDHVDWKLPLVIPVPTPKDNP